MILPYITKQILYASLVDFKHLLQYKTIKFADFVDAEFGEKASKLMMGCCVIVLSKGLYSAYCYKMLIGSLNLFVYSIIDLLIRQVGKLCQILSKLMRQQ